MDLTPISSVAGIEWPAIPTPAAASVLAMLYQLEYSQWWDPKTIQQAQLGQLQMLLRHACETVPFYRERIAAAGIDPYRRLDRETWARVPILSRREVQRGDLKSRRTPAEHGRTYELQTSGSTGEPVRITGTALNNFLWRVLTLRDHAWHGRDYAGRLAAIRAFGPETQPALRDGWGSATDGVYRTGPSGLLGMGLGVADQIRWLREFEPDYLLTMPSNLMALARYCAVHGVGLPRLREVRTVGETVTVELRQACREAWGVPLVDAYSSQEMGYIALQCPRHARYHVQSESVLVEILDDSDRPCAPGQIGRVVVTGLHSFAMPLVRYEVGDLAEAGEQCACGRGLPVINRILGRERNLLILPSGEQRWPLVGFMKYGEIAPVEQFKFIQHSTEEIEVLLVVARPLSEAEETALKTHMVASLDHPFRIRFTYLDAIPRGPGGKFEEFTSLVGRDQRPDRETG